MTTTVIINPVINPFHIDRIKNIDDFSIHRKYQFSFITFLPTAIWSFLSVPVLIFFTHMCLLFMDHIFESTSHICSFESTNFLQLLLVSFHLPTNPKTLLYLKLFTLHLSYLNIYAVVYKRSSVCKSKIF